MKTSLFTAAMLALTLNAATPQNHQTPSTKARIPKIEVSKTRQGAKEIMKTDPETEAMVAFDGRLEMKRQDVNKLVLFTTGETVDAEGSGYVIYRPFQLKKGETLDFKCGYVSDKIAILAEVDPQGRKIPIVQGTGAKVRENSFRYTADRDLNLALNCYDLYGNDCTFTIYRHQINALNYPPYKYRNTLSTGVWNRLKQRVVKVAYSATGIAINTREQFLSASLLGYDAQKADMELTKDNHIVMCHDQGVTVNEHGRSIRYDRENNKPIITMTRDEFCAIEHEVSLYQYGYYPKHVDLETYLRICKDTHVVPYMTIRNHNVDATLPILQKTLLKYNLQDNCIISSFPPNIENIIKCKDYLPNAAYVLVHHYNHPMTKQLVDQCKAVGNVLIQIQNEDTVINNSLEAIRYANQCGVPWGSYDIMSMDRYQYLVSLGCSMMQIYAPTFKETVRRLQLPIRFKNGNAEIVGAFGFTEKPSYTADITVEADKKILRIKNITYVGSKNQMPDALLNIWIHKLPILVTVCGGQVTSSYVDRETKEVVIHFSDMPTEATLDVLITI